MPPDDNTIRHLQAFQKRASGRQGRAFAQSPGLPRQQREGVRVMRAALPFLVEPWQVLFEVCCQAQTGTAAVVHERQTSEWRLRVSF